MGCTFGVALLDNPLEQTLSSIHINTKKTLDAGSLFIVDVWSMSPIPGVLICPSSLEVILATPQRTSSNITLPSILLFAVIGLVLLTFQSDALVLATYTYRPLPNQVVNPWTEQRPLFVTQRT